MKITILIRNIRIKYTAVIKKCLSLFLLPPAGISILLSLVVFLLLVSKILPPTSLVLPLIAKYLLFTFIMNTVSILVTVVIINWNFRGPRTHRMPQMTRRSLFLFVPPPLRPSIYLLSLSLYLHEFILLPRAQIATNQF